MSTSPPSDLRAGTLLADYLEQRRARRALADAARPANKAALFDALAGAGITAVIVAFDGSCDEGQIESITAFVGEAAVDLPPGLIAISQPRRDGSEVDVETCPPAEAIETLAYDCLEETHGGWEINDGAFGTFTFDVAARTVQLDYNERVMGTVSAEHVF